MILPNKNTRYTGEVKYFNKNQKYGFVSIDQMNNFEVFFHEDDILNIKKGASDILLKCFKGTVIKSSFELLEYMGKYKKSFKAINIAIN